MRAPLGALGIAITSLIVTIGTFWAFDRGAHDFTVFYGAWRMVIEGQAANLYHGTSDRFLYAPGFAWLFSPLGLLPRNFALAIWCFVKAAILGLLVREFQPMRGSKFASIGAASWGVAILARPLLIDFQYGQVNTLIVGACAWALLGHFRKGRGDAWDFARWFVLAVAALGKLFPLPLLVVPWLVREGIGSRKLGLERAGIIAGLLVTFLIPALTLGFSGIAPLMHDWHLALMSRGIPLESHNQSFTAFMHHFFSGELTHVVAFGMNPVPLGTKWLSETTIAFLSLAWMAITGGFLVAWLLSASRRPTASWIAVMIAVLILPSHLVWKPYFVMALPLAMLAASRARDTVQFVWLAVIFAAVNLTGFDVVGADLGARFEAGSVLLWAELGLIWFLLRSESGAPQLPQAIA
jgi:hypothetical protein